MDKAQTPSLLASEPRSELVARLRKAAAEKKCLIWHGSVGPLVATQHEDYFVLSGSPYGDSIVYDAEAVLPLERLTPTPEPCRLREALVEALSPNSCALCGKTVSQHTNAGMPVCQFYPVFVSERDMANRLLAKVPALSASPAEPEEATDSPEWRALKRLFDASKYHDPDSWEGEPAMIEAAQVLGEPPFGTNP